ncbi:MAG: bifunctional oligoribonuclease/PAP phosphatase NrnA [Phycisphaerae bacterium]|nr:bifunctional oligoribonuclease/PAP phosphatase NrnA [Phycisphaerae bacterium]
MSVNSPSCPADEDRQPTADFLDALRAVERPFIVAHVTPDADAIGAVLGLAATLREHGVDAIAGLTVDAVGMKLRFMFDLAPDVPCATEWQSDGRHDSLLVLDTAAGKRINIDPMPDFDGDIPIFNIDHHITNTDFGLHNWVDPHASSTCELIARLLRELGWKIRPNVASLLYAGIHGDTIGFSLSTSSAASLHTAGDLVEAGADVTHIGEQLCRSQGKSEFELLRRVYDHTTVTDDGHIAYSHLTYQDITESGCTAEDIDDQVSIPRALKNVQVALLFSEGEPGVIRVNFRGEGRIAVLDIAQQFGGGGHKQSAGVRLRDRTMEQAISEIVDATKAYLRSFASQ